MLQVIVILHLLLVGEAHVGDSVHHRGVHPCPRLLDVMVIEAAKEAMWLLHLFLVGKAQVGDSVYHRGIYPRPILPGSGLLEVMIETAEKAVWFLHLFLAVYHPRPVLPELPEPVVSEMIPTLLSTRSRRWAPSRAMRPAQHWTRSARSGRLDFLES